MARVEGKIVVVTGAAGGQGAAEELGPGGIRVNTILPGFIETPMTASAPEAFRRANIDVTPLGRVGRPEEVACAGRVPDLR